MKIKAFMQVLGLLLIFLALAFGFFQNYWHLHRPHKVDKVKATTVAVEKAVKSFLDTHSRLPDLNGLSAPNGGMTDTGDGVELLRILKAQEDRDGELQNPRKIDFLEISETKSGLKKDGLFYQGSSSAVGGLYDPWGNPYIVVLNTKYEDVLKVSTGGQSYELRGCDVAVISAGPDKEFGTKDDIKSFE